MANPQPSYRPDVPKNNEGQAWPKSRDPFEVSKEKAPKKPAKKAKGR